MTDIKSVGPDSERENRKSDQFWIWGLCPTLFTDKGQSLAYENTHMVHSTALNLALIAWIIAIDERKTHNFHIQHSVV